MVDVLDQSAVQSSRVIVVGQLPPPVNGSNKMAQILLSALKRSGRLPILVDKRFSNSPEEVGRASFRKISEIPSFLKRVINASKKSMASQCIYFTTSNLPSFLIDYISIRILSKQLPVVAYLHTDGYSKLAEKNWITKLLVKKMFRNCAVLVCLSKELEVPLVPLASKPKIKVIENTIDDSEFVIQKESFPNKSNYVLFLSNIEESKGILDFISFCELMNAKDPKLEYL